MPYEYEANILENAVMGWEWGEGEVYIDGGSSEQWEGDNGRLGGAKEH